MDAPVFVYTTYPSLVEAEKAGRALVEAGLAACVNILPEMVSIFRWKGQVERGGEAVMIIKTRASLKERVAVRVRETHPFETPAIVFLPTEGGDKDYVGWILEETAGAK
ncbi:MAG: divalent-cation tolerance protein CutA [Xanthobacteraceae bacterium]